MRRKGVPCGCTDNEGCCGLKEKLAILWDRTIGSIIKINDQTPDGDGKFRVQGGDNIEVSDISNGIEIGMKNPLTDDVTIQADLTVDGDIVANGDIIQNGSAYETHAEKIYTNDDYIVMREGAVGPLGSGDYSGFQVTKYDGTNDGRLVVDRDGTARVGDVGDEQPLATRDESADLTDEHLMKWDATNLKLVDAGVTTDDLKGLDFVAEISDSKLVSYPNQKSTMSIPLPTGVTFEDGNDYLIMISTAPSSADVGVRLVNDFALDGDTSFGIYFNSGESEFDYRANIYKMPASDPTQIKLYMASPSRMEVQEKLVSGTNIKTVGGQSILGSGDVPAGGLNWTLRTANNDWSDLFEIVNTSLVSAKKNIIIKDSNYTGYAFIPKGDILRNSTGAIQANKVPYISANDNNIYFNSQYVIDYLHVPSSNTRIQSRQYTVTITTDGSTISTSIANALSNVNKSSLKVYVSD